MGFVRDGFVLVIVTASLVWLTHGQLYQELPDFSYGRDPADNSVDLTWKPPEQVKKDFPWYISGFDYSGRLVFVVDGGRWKVRDAAYNGGDDLEIFRTYFDQMIQTFIILSLNKANASVDDTKSIRSTEVPDLEAGGGSALIVDVADFDITQLLTPQAWTLFLEIVVKLNTVSDHLAYAIFINMNGFVINLLRTARNSALSRALSRVEYYGTNRDRWVERLLKDIPRSQLPPKYGGFGNFTPIATYFR